MYCGLLSITSSRGLECIEQGKGLGLCTVLWVERKGVEEGKLLRPPRVQLSVEGGLERWWTNCTALVRDRIGGLLGCEEALLWTDAFPGPLPSHLLPLLSAVKSEKMASQHASLQHFMLRLFLLCLRVVEWQTCFIVVSQRTRLSFHPRMPERAAGSRCRASSGRSDTGIVSRVPRGSAFPGFLPLAAHQGRNAPQISYPLLFSCTFNLSGKVSGAYSIKRRTSSGSLILSGVGTEGTRRSTAMCPLYWDGRKRGQDCYQGRSILKRQTLKLICTNVLTADSYLIAKCQPFTA